MCPRMFFEHFTYHRETVCHHDVPQKAAYQAYTDTVLKLPFGMCLG